MDFLTTQNRARFFEIWQKAKANLPLEGEEALFAEIMLEHREHHPLFNLGEAAMQIDFAARRETNPFLHTSLHAVVEQQLAARLPAETEQALLSLLGRGESRHDAVHRIGGILAQVIHDAVTRNKPIDEGDYISKLRGLIF
ncbi:MAG TPA: DUF1841 family protein [Candidatus Manganitrophaceae bacterium]|nr:DUF1841 family protein [Candidatus Manganitrophaceae bacterium]